MSKSRSPKNAQAAADNAQVRPLLTWDGTNTLPENQSLRPSRYSSLELINWRQETWRPADPPLPGPLCFKSASLFLRKLDEIDRTPGIDEGSAKLCAIHWTTGRQVASSSKKALQGEMLHKAIVVSNACFQQHQKVVCEFHDIREGRLRVYFVKFERGRDGDFVTLDYTLRSAPKDWVIYKLDTTSAPKSPTLREITHQFVQMSAKMGGYSVRWSNCWMMARIFTVLIAGPIVHDLGFEHIALLTRTYKEQIRWLTALIGVYRRLDMLLLPQLWVSGLDSLKALHLPSLSKLDSGGNEAAIQVRDRRWEQEESEKWWQSYREREEWRRSLGCSGKVNV